jgi:hypothetical protein
LRKSAAKRFVNSLERDLALHREMLEIMRGPESPIDETCAAHPELGFTASLCLAARVRGALTSALADAEHGGGVYEMLESLPADEAARTAELRREFERVLAALSRKQQAGASSVRPS